MQIKFRPTGTTLDIKLAGSWTEETSDLTGEVSEQVQRLEYWQGTEPQWKSRGNKFATRSWSSHRTFDSIVECELFLLEHGTNEGGSDITTMVGVFEFTMDDGSRQALRYASGTLRIGVADVIGVSLRVTYNIEYGIIRLSRPSS